MSAQRSNKICAFFFFYFFKFVIIILPPLAQNSPCHICPQFFYVTKKSEKNFDKLPPI